ncbi:dual CXXC motif small (seleno)protein [Desulfovibrio inopinatus]
MRCRACGRQYPLSRFLDEMDDEFEDAFANVPLNRL